MKECDIFSAEVHGMQSTSTHRNFDGQLQPALRTCAESHATASARCGCTKTTAVATLQLQWTSDHGPSRGRSRTE